MPVAISYPGVYVEEIPSGVRTITGVATSIAAFAGWAPQGPTDQAGLVLSWSDFVNQYGGLNPNSYLGYAVSQFFLNGGQQAYIVRLVTAGDPTPANNAATASLALSPLSIKAQNPGQWANNYAIAIKNQASGTRFQLQVVYIDPTDSTGKTQTVVESFANLSAASPDPQGRYVGDVVNNTSNYITIDPITQPPSPAQPANTPVPLTAAQKLAGGGDGVILEPNTGGFETALVPSSGVGGIYLLDHVDLFNLLVVPGEFTPATLASLESYCVDHRAFLLADCDPNASMNTLKSGPDSQLSGVDGTNAAFYFPWVTAPDPLSQNLPSQFPPSGFVAGIYARTDGTRGVWKAPAGTEATLTGATGVVVPLNDKENGVLNPQAINCIRNFNVYGTIIWGARTLQGSDEIGSEWKYIPVRRTALFIEESLFRALKWVVFEPNDEPLWAEIRLNVGAFMQNLFRQGAFQGKTPADAYFVKCDKETTTQNDINMGIVNIVVGFAPLKPAEFVVIQIQQMAGQIAT
ncbi:MAG: phage tail sheath family protein [Candidatus Sulfotelmatobacter sp.]